MNENKVLLAMSGGVDSSVAAILLKENGYELVGVTIKTWNYSERDLKINKQSSCCSLEEIFDAKNVANQFNIPHYTIDLTERFAKKIIDNFIDEYRIGRTPNPCVLCNKYIKWEELLKKADELNIKYIATGHYASVLFDDTINRYKIKKGIDNKKDQSYVLWQLTQDQLSRTILPLGSYTKTEIREIARKNNLKTADKPESQEICFIPDDDHSKFLREEFRKKNISIPRGNFILDEKVIGTHDGIPYYTIGQRRGLNIALGRPIYVKKISKDTNEIELGDKNNISNVLLNINNINFVSKRNIPIGEKVYIKIRYSDKSTEAEIIQIKEDRMQLKLFVPKSAITPGQSAVAYDSDGNLLFGGFISENE